MCYHVIVIRTQIQLSDEDYRKLKTIAAREGRSMADCIREGILLFFRQVSSDAQDLDSIAGAFRPVSLEDLKPHDRHWAETIGRGRDERNKE